MSLASAAGAVLLGLLAALLLGVVLPGAVLLAWARWQRRSHAREVLAAWRRPNPETELGYFARLRARAEAGKPVTRTSGLLVVRNHDERTWPVHPLGWTGVYVLGRWCAVSPGIAVDVWDPAQTGWVRCSDPEVRNAAIREADA